MQIPLPVLVALSPGDLREQDARLFLGRVERAVAGGLEALLLRERELCDRAYVLEQGRIAMTGSGAELLDNPHVKAAYLGIGDDAEAPSLNRGSLS